MSHLYKYVFNTTRLYNDNTNMCALRHIYLSISISLYISLSIYLYLYLYLYISVCPGVAAQTANYGSVLKLKKV